MIPTKTAHQVTQIYPVVSCSNQTEVRVIMARLGVVRSDVYNKLGSLKGWGLHWQKAYPIIKVIKDASQYQLPSKLCEWTVSDVQKNSRMIGELQDSLESIALQTGSKVQVVNAAYTSQVDHLTGTLLGFRDGDSFIRCTRDVLQADYNAANNIRSRGTDEAGDAGTSSGILACRSEIPRYMKSEKVLTVLLDRTVRFLASFGWTVADAVELGWLQSKFYCKSYCSRS